MRDEFQKQDEKDLQDDPAVKAANILARREPTMRAFQIFYAGNDWKDGVTVAREFVVFYERRESSPLLEIRHVSPIIGANVQSAYDYQRRWSEFHAQLPGVTLFEDFNDVHSATLARSQS